LTAGIGIAAFLATHMDIVWVAAGIAAGWLGTHLFVRLRGPQAPNPLVRQTGQVLVGVSLGPTLAGQSLSEVAIYLPLLVGAVAAALAGSIVIARAYSSVNGVDGMTAGLATLPGGIGVMASVAAEMGRPASLVALVQGLRMALVVSVVPLVSVVVDGEMTRESVPALFPGDLPSWVIWVVIVIAAFGAWRVAVRLRVTVPALLGPMALGVILAAAVRLSGADADLVELPFFHSVLGQALLGITVGEYLAQRSRSSRKAVWGGVAGALATLLLAGLLATVLYAITPWSVLTCLLITAPGGAPEMIVVAAATSPEDLQLVVVAQLLRQIAVNALMPVWIRIFRRFPSA
jgi:membrane AbrB-like protein